MLYRLPELLAAPRENWVFVVEGEKDVETLRKSGLCATTNPGGAGNWKNVDDAPLARRRVCVLADNDDAGRRHANDVAMRLCGQTADLRVVELPGLVEKSDVSDWLATNPVSDLLKLVESATNFTAEASPSTAIEWSEPIPLGCFELPEFPLSATPKHLGVLRSFVEEVAESLQVPPDVPATLVLAAGAAAFGGRVEVNVQADWIEPTNLFVAVAMQSGERKSAVFRKVFAPLLAFETEQSRYSAPQIDMAGRSRSILENALKKAERDVAVEKNPGLRTKALQRVAEFATELRETPALQPLRLFADDATPEAIAELLATQAGRIAILSPEGDVFDLMAGRYSTSGTPNLGVYLKGHAGDDLRVDRVSKDRPPAHVERPALTIGVAVQPDVVAGLAKHASFRGRGLIARILFSMPISKVGRRQLHPIRVSQETSRDYEAVMRRSMQFGHGGSRERTLDVVTLSISDDALPVLDDLRSEVEDGLAYLGTLAAIPDWASKLPGAVCRIAGILHCFGHVRDHDFEEKEIDRETMAFAVAIGRYLIDHAVAAYQIIGADPVTTLARRLITWIRDTKTTRFSRRDAFLRIRSPNDTVGIVDPPLALLNEHRYIRQRPEEPRCTQRGRKPSVAFDVNPSLLTQNVHNTQKSDADRISEYCAQQSRPENST